MNNIKENKLIIVVCLLLICIFLFGYYQYNKNNTGVDLSENYKDNSDSYLKNYKINQFIPIYITQSDMARIYLNDYKNKMINNVNEAYDCLNLDYRNKKFGSIDSYKEYVNSLLGLSTYSMEVKEFSVSTDNGYKFFNVYDKDGNNYIFKELSIINYEVFLDDNTVEVK